MSDRDANGMDGAAMQHMPPAPVLPPIDLVPLADADSPSDWSTLLERHSDVHRQWMVLQADHHKRFLEMRARSIGVFFPPVAPPPSDAGEHAPRLRREQVRAFADGRLAECFGPEFDLLSTHTRSPGAPNGRPVLFDEVLDMELAGAAGSAYAGLLRARWSPPSQVTLSEAMLVEGGIQAMALYVIALGQTLDRDGFRLETNFLDARESWQREEIPSAGEVIYDVIVRAIGGEPSRGITADLLCTVGGQAVLRATGMQMLLVQDWPLTSRPELLALRETRPVAHIGELPLGYASVLASAWGRPSDAFGDMYRHLDETQRVPRLPGPPFLFISRIVELHGEMGVAKPGVGVVVEYDIPDDAWYFTENGSRRLPFVVLLEAALQPCGWLAGYAGCPLSASDDLRFRNLDGAGTVVSEIPPGGGVLRTRVELTRVAKSAGMYILGYDIACTIGDREVYTLHSVFGFFPKEALAQQVGLPTTPEDEQWLTEPSDFVVDLTEQPSRYCSRPFGLAGPMLLMLDRVMGYWPSAGRAGLGRLRAEKDVDPTEWFFKAHFYQDPVQPGSLGLESMLQLLQFYMLEQGLGADIPNPRFETIALGDAHSWKYRGQVLPANTLVTTDVEILRVERDERGVVVIADASLWVDGKRTYEAKNIGMRIVPGVSDEVMLDPATDTWIHDHCPTYTVPALPMMSLIDIIARAAAEKGGGRQVVAIEDLVLHRWALADQAVRLRTTVTPGGDDASHVTLAIWRTAARADLSRFEALAEARVRLADQYPAAPAPLAPLDGGEPEESPYTSGHMFHGPAFQGQRSWTIGRNGSSSVLDATPSSVPVGLLHPALLDATTHGIPHDRLECWSGDIAAGQLSFPSRVQWMRFYGPPPVSGTLQCDVRFDGFDGDVRFPIFRIQARDGDRVWVDYRIVTVMFPQGPLMPADARDRQRFFGERHAMPELALSTVRDGVTTLAQEAYGTSNWLPGTLASLYALTSPHALEEIAVKEHVVRKTGSHPSRVAYHPEAGFATCDASPLTQFPVDVRREGDRSVTVRDAGADSVELAPAVPTLERLTGAVTPAVRRLYTALARTFVSRIVLRDVDAMERLRGKSVLYLGNHQSQIESILFATLLTAVQEVPVVVLANAKHRDRWVGRLLRLTHPEPESTGADLVRYFDQSRPESLAGIIDELRGDLEAGRRSFMVHVEGTRQTSARDEIEKVSSLFTDLSISARIPIVPIRFANGLPVKPLRKGKLEFPVGYGAQEYRLGSPLDPAELAALPLAGRRRRVLDALRALMGSPVDEAPAAPRPELAAAVAALMKRDGVDEVSAVLATLADHDPDIISQL